MKITVIGFWHGYPERGEATSSYLLEHNDFKLLLDCGSGVMAQLPNYCSIHDLNGIVLSHYHGDHQADIRVFQYSQLLRKDWDSNGQPLHIYAHNHNKAEFEKLNLGNRVKAVAYHEGKPMEIGPFQFSFLRTKHPVPCFAFRVTVDGGRSLVYTADSSYFDELGDFAKGCNLLISECSGYENDDPSAFGHMNSKDAGNLAKRANTGTLLLSHLPHYGEHSQLKREANSVFSGEVKIASTGLTLEI